MRDTARAGTSECWHLQTGYVLNQDTEHSPGMATAEGCVGVLWEKAGKSCMLQIVLAACSHLSPMSYSRPLHQNYVWLWLLQALAF